MIPGGRKGEGEIWWTRGTREKERRGPERERASSGDPRGWSEVTPPRVRLQCPIGWQILPPGGSFVY